MNLFMRSVFLYKQIFHRGNDALVYSFRLCFDENINDLWNGTNVFFYNKNEVDRLND